MKKTSEKIGVESKIDYFKIFRETPDHLRKRMTMREFHDIMLKVREEKEKQKQESSFATRNQPTVLPHEAYKPTGKKS
jgi:hypothetical protein